MTAIPWELFADMVDPTKSLNKDGSSACAVAMIFLPKWAFKSQTKNTTSSLCLSYESKLVLRNTAWIGVVPRKSSCLYQQLSWPQMHHWISLLYKLSLLFFKFHLILGRKISRQLLSELSRRVSRVSTLDECIHHQALFHCDSCCAIYIILAVMCSNSIRWSAFVSVSRILAIIQLLWASLIK